MYSCLCDKELRALSYELRDLADKTSYPSSATPWASKAGFGFRTFHERFRLSKGILWNSRQFGLHSL